MFTKTRERKIRHYIPAVGQIGNLETKKQNAENKPKTKKIKKEAGVNAL